MSAGESGIECSKSDKISPETDQANESRAKVRIEEKDKASNCSSSSTGGWAAKGRKIIPAAQGKNNHAIRETSNNFKSPRRIFSREDSDLNNSDVFVNTWTNEDSVLGHGPKHLPVTNKHSSASSSSSSSQLTPIDNVGLLYYSREPIMPKDFSSEVRAPMDVEQFAHQAELLLDSDTVSMEEIINSMLQKVTESEHLSLNRLDQIRDSIFVSGSTTLMARTIQGVLSDDNDKQAGASKPAGSDEQKWKQQHQHQSRHLKHDQSWLCALCNLALVTRRHMVMARFRAPMNLGENAHHVRLFVLVVVPSKEKSTKDQLETGRTFATMLTDSKFRQQLLEARDETEFRSLMVLRAQQLAQVNQLKNRHKYLLDAALQESVNGGHLEFFPARPKGALLSSNQRHISLDGQHSVSSTKGSLFQKNPHTTKLFELISLPDNNNKNNNNNNNKDEKGNQDRQPGLGDLDKKKLAKLEEQPQSSSCQKGDIYYWSVIRENFEFGKSAWEDFTRRLRLYPSDFRDGFIGPPKTIQKTISTIWFLYFGILLPTIAFSSLNTTQTQGHMGDLRKALIGQAIGGLGFALLSGQPLVIIMTTAPLCLYTKVIHKMCQDYGFHFPAMYAAVGLWNGVFLVLYSMLGFSRLMKWCTRSTEEIFAMFIVIAFISDAYKDLMKNFYRFYYTPACSAQNNQTYHMLQTSNQSLAGHSLLVNSTQNDSGYRDLEEEIEGSVCRRETSLLFLLLMLGTLTLYKFRRTQYLSSGKRDLLADYALPTAVILMSIIGASVFYDIHAEKFPPLVDVHFERAAVESLPISGILTSLALGFTLSLLFFMDQNISAAMVNTPQNRLKKGDAFHYDLFIVGLLNGFLTLYGLPMMHGVLPHSPLHARSLADIEEQVDEGHLREVVVNARETRVTAVVAHILLLGSLLLIPYPIAYIPRAVLNGLFLYMAVTSLDGLQLFERLMLVFTEQSKYPPNHYIRRCPQRKIHQFTLIQLLQLMVMCAFGFSPFNVVEMFFPVIILLMIPFRHRVVTRMISEKYLDALDGKH